MSFKEFRFWLKSFKEMHKKNNISFEKLVQRINELYFDITSEEYQKSHPSIFFLEKKRWQRIAQRYLNNSQTLKILDVGTGSGFVPLSIASYFKESDTFFCMDISKGILEVAKKNINNQYFPCKFIFQKIMSQIPYKLPFKSNFFEILTINSLLHHINDIKTFLYEIDRVLKPNGFLIIGHEPNRYFYESKFLWKNYLLLNEISKIIGKILEKFFKNHINNENLILKRKKISSNINKILLKEKLINKPLNYEQITLIVDIKSTKGFKPDLLLNNYKIIYFETYNHLFWVSDKNFFYKIYNKILKIIYPTKGSTFLILLRKLN